MARSEGEVREVRGDAELVVAARSGAPDVFGELVARWFDRCWEVAWRILRDRELAADVAQETLLRAWEDLATLQQPASFGGWVLRIARNRALDRQRRERWTVPTADDADLEPAARERPADEDPARRAEQRQAAELVWSAAAVLGERDLSLLDLHLRHGLEPHELADELGLAPNAAHQALFRMRKRLGGAVRARLMWHDGEPACVGLRAELAAAGSDRFDATTVRLIDRHVPDCLSCSDEHARVVDPAGMFAALPFVAAPVALRAEAVRWLGGAGVPIDPAYAATGGAPERSDHGADTHDDGGEGGHGPGTAAGTRPSRGWRRRLSVVAGAVAALLVVGVVVAGELQDGLQPPEEAVAAGSLDRSPPPVERAPEREPAPVEDDGAGREGGAVPDLTLEADDPAPPPVSPEPRAPSSPRPHEPGEADPDAPEQPVRTEEPSAEPSDEPTDTPTSPPPAAPVVEEFVVRAGATCPRSGGHAHSLAWETSAADTVSLTVGDRPSEQVATSGTVQRCAPLGTTFELTATGPGGTVRRTATAN